MQNDFPVSLPHVAQASHSMIAGFPACVFAETGSESSLGPVDATASFPLKSVEESGHRACLCLREGSLQWKSVNIFIINFNSSYNPKLKMITKHF